MVTSPTESVSNKGKNAKKFLKRVIHRRKYENLDNDKKDTGNQTKACSIEVQPGESGWNEIDLNAVQPKKSKKSQRRTNCDDSDETQNDFPEDLKDYENFLKKENPVETNVINKKKGKRKKAKKAAKKAAKKTWKVCKSSWKYLKAGLVYFSNGPNTALNPGNFVPGAFTARGAASY